MFFGARFRGNDERLLTPLTKVLVATDVAEEKFFASKSGREAQ
jgi:hypothetical protein